VTAGRGRLAALAVAAALAAPGCSPGRREAERAVRAYDDAVILAYRTRDGSRLGEVATERERRKVVALVDLKAASRLVLESELQSLEVTEVAAPAPGRMTVRTRERWRYRDRPLDPGREPGTVFVAEMAMEYGLARSAGAWVVDETRTLSNVFVDPGAGR
jgi:hypothetical protein